MLKKFSKIFIISIMLICGCNNKELSKEEQLQSIIKEDNYIIIDVRTKQEYDLSHVKNSINIPYDTIDENTKLDKTKKILVYCQSGKRSNIAYNTLTDLGYDVLDLGAYNSINLEKE